MKKVDSVVSVDEIAEITGLNNKKGNCIRVYAHSLRQRIGPGLIETVKGRGYILRSANY